MEATDVKARCIHCSGLTSCKTKDGVTTSAMGKHMRICKMMPRELPDGRDSKHPSGRLVDANEDYEARLKEEPVIAFSGEEGNGRYLDLHEYINSKFGERVEYRDKLKLSRQYRKYMEALLEYLVYFFQRTEPLQDLDRILSSRCKILTGYFLAVARS
ncbi:predicted protein [Arabidopsis lyrata subsp. lyrata]|uniref:Predicted protein n=1 Tax=Arabidopsis lyrata subsp. lyrata TaxID=81972 RepID=D7MJH2_ARALL|nr:predicted protein [Arabidopsis lyrata subsp. lyrata]